MTGHREYETLADGRPIQTVIGPRVSWGAMERARKAAAPHQFPASVLKIMRRMRQRIKEGRWSGISAVIALLVMTATASAATVKYTQVGKDCVVSANGSARVAHNTKCPDR